jgi:hypothetical protein
MRDEPKQRGFAFIPHPSSLIPSLRPSARCYRLRFLGSITAARVYAAFPGCGASGNAGAAWGRRNSGRGGCPRAALRARGKSPGAVRPKPRSPFRERKETGDGVRRRLGRNAGGVGTWREAAGERPRGIFRGRRLRTAPARAYDFAWPSADRTGVAPCFATPVPKEAGGRSRRNSINESTSSCKKLASKADEIKRRGFAIPTMLRARGL